MDDWNDYNNLIVVVIVCNLQLKKKCFQSLFHLAATAVNSIQKLSHLSCFWFHLVFFLVGSTIHKKKKFQRQRLRNPTTRAIEPTNGHLVSQPFVVPPFFRHLTVFSFILYVWILFFIFFFSRECVWLYYFLLYLYYYIFCGFFIYYFNWTT